MVFLRTTRFVSQQQQQQQQRHEPWWIEQGDGCGKDISTTLLPDIVRLPEINAHICVHCTSQLQHTEQYDNIVVRAFYAKTYGDDYDYEKHEVAASSTNNNNNNNNNKKEVEVKVAVNVKEQNSDTRENDNDNDDGDDTPPSSVQSSMIVVHDDNKNGDIDNKPEKKKRRKYKRRAVVARRTVKLQKSNRAVLNADIVSQICLLHGAFPGLSSIKIAKQYGVSPKAVRDIWHGRTWRHVTKIKTFVMHQKENKKKNKRGAASRSP